MPSFDLRAKFCGDRPKGIPPSGALNARLVANRAMVDLSKAISDTYVMLKAGTKHITAVTHVDFACSAE